VVFVPSQQHCQELLRYDEQGEEVAVFMRMVVLEPSGDWQGFPTFDPQKAFRPWAFVSKWITKRGVLVEKNIEPIDAK